MTKPPFPITQIPLLYPTFRTFSLPLPRSRVPNTQRHPIPSDRRRAHIPKPEGGLHFSCNVISRVKKKTTSTRHRIAGYEWDILNDKGLVFGRK